MILKNRGNLFFASIWLIGYFVQNAEYFTGFYWVYLPPAPIAGFPACVLVLRECLIYLSDAYRDRVPKRSGPRNPCR